MWVSSEFNPADFLSRYLSFFHSPSPSLSSQFQSLYNTVNSHSLHRSYSNECCSWYSQLIPKCLEAVQHILPNPLYNPLSVSGVNTYILHCFNCGNSSTHPISAYSMFIFWSTIESYSLNSLFWPCLLSKLSKDTITDNSL